MKTNVGRKVFLAISTWEVMNVRTVDFRSSNGHSIDGLSNIKLPMDTPFSEARALADKLIAENGFIVKRTLEHKW